MSAIQLDRYETEDIVFTTRRYCKTCEEETMHQIHRTSSAVARLCIPCTERTANYELDRD